MSTSLLVSLVSLKSVVSKTMKQSVVKRQFQFHTSVFKNWQRETTQKKKESIDIDCQLWKLKKFIKEESEVSKPIGIKVDLDRKVQANRNEKSGLPEGNLC